MLTEPWLIAFATSTALIAAGLPSARMSQNRLENEHLISVQEDEAAKHLQGDWPDIRLLPSEAKTYRPFQGIRYTITVDKQGAVTEVGFEEDPLPAGAYQGEQLIRKLKFNPFQRDGHAVAARFSFYVPVFPPERSPTRHVAFPAVANRNSLVITLERTSCYGTCPSYRVEVRGDGKVEYDGQCFVAERGHRVSKISAEAVDELVQLFEEADYFSLDEEYSSPVTDMPSYTTSISFDGHKKSITDYYGVEMGMPDTVKKIERSIDRVTNSNQWLSRSGRWKPSKRERCR